MPAANLSPSASAVSGAQASVNAPTHVTGPPRTAGTSGATATVIGGALLTPSSAATSGAQAGVIGGVLLFPSISAVSSSQGKAIGGVPLSPLASSTSGAQAGVIGGVVISPATAATSGAQAQAVGGVPLTPSIAAVSSTAATISLTILLIPTAGAVSGAVANVTAPTFMSLSSASASSGAVEKATIIEHLDIPHAIAVSGATAFVHAPAILTPHANATSSMGVVVAINRLSPLPISVILKPRQKAVGPPSVDWKWYIAQPTFSGGIFNGFDLITPLFSARSRTLNLALNGVESASFTVHTLDAAASYINPITTALVCYRNGQLKWSGPIWTINETVGDSQGDVQVQAVGWFQLLMYRLLKCGTYLSNPMVGPASTSTAIANYYYLQDPVSIAVDMVQRTNYEYPTGVSVGSTPGNPNNVQWSVTVNQLQNIGQMIQQLSNIESGFDFRVDPVTLALNFYYGTVKSGYTIYGRGNDRPNAIFRFGSNLSTLSRLIDPSKLTTQETVIGQYGQSQYPDAPQSTGRGDTLDPAIAKYGSWQAMSSLSNIVSPTITAAYATEEVLFLNAPQVIYSFNPIQYHQALEDGASVPQPLEDYDIGDFVYLGSNYGRMVVPPPGSGIVGYLPVRVYSFQLAIDNEGNERVTNVQTTYSTTS